MADFEDKAEERNETWSESPKSNTILLACGVATYGLLLATVILIARLLIYGRRMKLLQVQNQRGKIFAAYCVCVVIGSIRLLAYVFLFHISMTPEAMKKCELLVDIVYSFIFLGISSTYVFLWIRQKAVYASAYIRSVSPRWVIAVSNYSIIWIAASTVIFSAAYGIPETFQAGPHGCEYRPSVGHLEKKKEWHFIRKYAVLGVIASTQLLLLFLFVYPMIKVKLMAKKSFKNTRKKGENTMIKKMITRSLICSIVVIVTDVLSMVVLRRQTNVVMIAHTITNFDILINHVSLLMTFNDFRSMMGCIQPSTQEIDEKLEEVVVTMREEKDSTNVSNL